MIKQYDEQVKLILIGGSGVGKTSMLMQFAENKFSDNYLTTVGVDFRFKTIQEDGRRIKLQIWDTAGQDRFRTVTSAYYKGADGVIMVFDHNDPLSINDLENYWIPEVNCYCDKDIKVMLAGNKCDIEKRVKPQRPKSIAQKYSYKLEQVSAKTGERVYDAIKNFGIEVAKIKLEKMGIEWKIIEDKNSEPFLVKRADSSITSWDINGSNGKSPQINSITELKKNKKPGEPSYHKKCC